MDDPDANGKKENTEYIPSLNFI